MNILSHNASAHSEINCFINGYPGFVTKQQFLNGGNLGMYEQVYLDLNNKLYLIYLGTGKHNSQSLSITWFSTFLGMAGSLVDTYILKPHLGFISVVIIMD